MMVTIVMNYTLVNAVLLTKFIGRLNPNKTKALVITIARTVSPSQGDLFLFEVSISASPYLDILGVKFDSKLTFEGYVLSIVFQVFQVSYFEVGESIFVDTSVLLCCYFVFVLPILEYYSLVWESAAKCHLQLLECQVYSVARLCPDKFPVIVSSTSCGWA